jgi:hypothetical protein
MPDIDAILRVFPGDHGAANLNYVIDRYRSNPNSASINAKAAWPPAQV